MLWWARAIVVAACALRVAFAGTLPADAARGCMPVGTQVIVRALHAYGQVAPMTVVRVRVAAPGTLAGLRALPGRRVTEGEALGRLGGPRMQTLRVDRAQALRSAEAREHAAGRLLRGLQRRREAQLATRQAVDAAQRDLTAARAAVRIAKAQLQELRALEVLRAPTAGTVLAVQAANGEEVEPGETIMTLQPAGRLWIRATYDGADAAALHVGMRGRFAPAGGGDAMPVEVASMFAAMANDGGVQVGLVPQHAPLPPWWINGQWGSLTLDGPARRMVMVPTQALVLDDGRWWVLVHTPKGDMPRRVVPGPAHGWLTAVASGLQPGDDVVVTDAYLEFHRGIARAYTPPD